MVMMAGVLLRCLAVACLMLLVSCSRPVERMKHQAYVWQHRWTPPVKEALAESAPLVEGWRVLAAEIGADGRVLTPSVDFLALAASQRPVIAVIRIEARLDGANEARIISDIVKLLESWRNSSIRLTGIEIDHDASLRTLEPYAHFLQALRNRLDRSLALSITLLPTWLESPHLLSKALTPVDEAVLQLHALANPSRQLFDPEHAWQWLNTFAQQSRKPFRIALPNYGSRITLDDKRRVIAIESEGPTLAQNGEWHELYSSPTTIAAFLRELEHKRPDNLRGIVWFRLPIASDQRCWSRSTWQAVIRKENIEVRLKMKSTPTEHQGWQNVVLINEGLIDAEYPATLDVAGRCEARGEMAYLAEQKPDATSWLRQRKGLLRAGEKMLIGRLRCSGTVGPIEIVW